MRICRLALFSFVLLAIGCSVTRAPLVGKWSGPAALMETDFSRDGSVTQSSLGQSLSGSYEVEQIDQAKILKMDFGTTTQTYEIVSITPDEIVLKEGAAQRVLRRISEK